ncbi:MAG: hypothetical protein EOM72_10145 [Opitutae bacterium]|nr:hypothetical protein [Opitutae bacterium]
MGAMKRISWGLGGAWVIGLLLAAGCSDDDEADSSESGATVVTNAVTSDGQTTFVVVTNTVAADDADDAAVDAADAEEEAGPDVAPQLAAPQKVAPANGTVFHTTPRKPYLVVTCQWTPVPGAVDYVYTMNGRDFIVENTSSSSRFGTTASYTWSVRARDAAQREGLSSGKAIFHIQRIDF